MARERGHAGWLSIATLLLCAPLITAETTDATKSTSTGNGLQYATSGVLAAFTVTAKVRSPVPRHTCKHTRQRSTSKQDFESTAKV